MSGRRCSVICKDKKELMVPFYFSQLLQAFVLYFFAYVSNGAFGTLVEGDR